MPFWRKKDKGKQPQTTANTQSPHGEPFRSQGNQLAEKNDYNGAVVMYNSALQQAPRNLTLYLSRSLAHVMSTPTRFDLALKDADDAIRLDPSHSQAWAQKGEVLMKMGQGAGAVEALTQAVAFAGVSEKFAAQRSLAAAQALSAGSAATMASSAPMHTTATTNTPGKQGWITYYRYADGWNLQSRPTAHPRQQHQLQRRPRRESSSTALETPPKARRRLMPKTSGTQSCWTKRLPPSRKCLR